MAADGSTSGGKKQPSEKVEWSRDPTIFRMQVFAYGYEPGHLPAVVDRIYIQAPWFKEAKTSTNRVLRMAPNARKENNVNLEGPSRSGKTSLARALLRENMPKRDESGLQLPWGYFRVPSVPSSVVVAQQLLRSLGDASWSQRRSPVERLDRIREVADMVGLKMLIVDDLHRLVDSRGTKVQHAVADLFIDIGDETSVPFMFLGLERMAPVFNVNEQLRGRTGAAIRCLRLDWRIKSQRELFCNSVEAVTKKLRLEMPFDHTMTDLTLAFRLYCSTGGLLGYLIKIIRVAEYERLRRMTPMGFELLRRGVLSVVGRPASWPGRKDPFHPDFVGEVSDEALRLAAQVGREVGPNASGGRGAHPK